VHRTLDHSRPAAARTFAGGSWPCRRAHRGTGLMQRRPGSWTARGSRHSLPGDIQILQLGVHPGRVDPAAWPARCYQERGPDRSRPRDDCRGDRHRDGHTPQSSLSGKAWNEREAESRQKGGPGAQVILQRVAERGGRRPARRLRRRRGHRASPSSARAMRRASSPMSRALISWRAVA